ncbi:GNAT family N-acetyltransferase [Novosphingobium sp.]|uniref:GNAT family N-acetyltransferase n=1 Tax=Novosphingobium sp. TaxID=1874826 RepID=UPI003B52E916
MTVYHADINEAQADLALLAPGPGITPFDRIAWLRLMAQECLAPARAVIAVAQDGDAIAALPLVLHRTGYAALGNWYSFIARPLGTDPALLTAIMRSLNPVGALSFAPLPEREAVLLRDAARRAGWVAQLRHADHNHVLRTAGADFATWWAKRPGLLRETVRRKSRKGAVTIRIATTFDDADWDAYEAIYASSWKPAESSPQLLRRFARDEGAAGRLRLGLAHVDGTPVAAQFWTVEDGTAFIHKLAHDPAATAHSPGTLLSHALFAMAFDQDRVALIDFGTGDDGYKRDWMDEVRPRYRLDAVWPGNPRRWPALARLLARAILRPDALARPETCT